MADGSCWYSGAYCERPPPSTITCGSSASTEGTQLSRLYPGVERARVNSIHHQGIKDLAPEFVAEAFSVPDGMVEAIRRKDPAKSYIAALQWHPEFHQPGSDTIDDAAVLERVLSSNPAALYG